MNIGLKSNLAFFGTERWGKLLFCFVFKLNCRAHTTLVKQAEVQGRLAFRQEGDGDDSKQPLLR